MGNWRVLGISWPVFESAEIFGNDLKWEYIMELNHD